MPMPHRTFAQVARRRLAGTEGAERIRVLRLLMSELPEYRNGPYADLRKWLEQELEQTRGRGRVVHRDSLQVRREGAAQVALVGAPNAGKSSLLQALSEIQIRTGDYAFTTLRPVPALTRIGGIPVQLVEIPGLIEDAHEGRGGGKALLGVLRNADAIVWCHAVTASPEELVVARREVAAAGIEKRGLLAATKADEAAPGSLERLAAAAPDLAVLPVSILDDGSLERLREAVWGLTGLVRVYPRRDGRVDPQPFALAPGATVADVATRIHDDLGRSCRGARVWGPSVRFAGQRVGRGHLVADGDVLEIVT